MNVATTLEHALAWVLRASWQASLVAAVVLAVHLLTHAELSDDELRQLRRILSGEAK